MVPAQSESVAEHMREAVILAALVSSPSVIAEFESDIERMRCADGFHKTLRDIILRHPPDADRETINSEIARLIGPDALENLITQSHVAIIPCIRFPDDIEKVRLTVSEELAKLRASQGLDAEIADAVEDMVSAEDEGLTWRVSEAARAAEQARRSGQEDREEYEISENGARISRTEKNALDALLETIKSQKPHS